MAQPNTTLYLNNLNDKINKEELRIQLHALFNTHGRLIDVVATKSPKMRGQAFLVFADLAGATSALRACEGMTFYDKPMVRAIAIFEHQVIEHIAIVVCSLAHYICQNEIVRDLTQGRSQLCRTELDSRRQCERFHLKVRKRCFVV